MSASTDAGQMKAALQEQARKVMKAHPDPLRPCMAPCHAEHQALLPSPGISEVVPASQPPGKEAELALVPSTPSPAVYTRAGLVATAASEADDCDGHAAAAEQAASPCSQPMVQPGQPGAALAMPGLAHAD